MVKSMPVWVLELIRLAFTKLMLLLEARKNFQLFLYIVSIRLLLWNTSQLIMVIFTSTSTKMLTTKPLFLIQRLGLGKNLSRIPQGELLYHPIMIKGVFFIEVPTTVFMSTILLLNPKRLFSSQALALIERMFPDW